MKFMIGGKQALGDLPFHIQKDILARLPVTVLLMFKCVSKTWSTLIGNPYSLNTSEAAFTEPHNCLITRPDQYHHLATRSRSSFNIDPIFSTMRELHLWKAPSARKNKIVWCGSSIHSSPPKLKLVKYGSLIWCGIPPTKFKLVEYCILKPILNAHKTQKKNKEPKWVFSSTDVVFFKRRLFEALLIYMSIWAVDKYVFMVSYVLGLDIFDGYLRGEWWE